MKKLLSLLLALALVMSCAAALAEDYYPAEKVSYNVWIRMRPMNGDADQMEIFKIMEEKTNVHLNFEQIPQADAKRFFFMASQLNCEARLLKTGLI